ncbi:threonine--tRNA ligase 1, cytoplasmic-like isoform X2 [Chiloscyllium punctatum]|uniref:threonine--tRNA ligase 1, cytoplasmic-like isoform X2 n=1 Tax=Chiloscyllium punctatum TaxID=137246 RepID=UPI003B63D1AF
MAALWEVELRLSAQEVQLYQLSATLERLQRECEEVLGGPELQCLREENEKLKYRRLHLERSLRAELGKTPQERWTEAQEQELFFFHELSPGSCFFLPRGAFIYNTLKAFIQVDEEISECLDFVRSVYGVFGFSFQYILSTRPEKFLGDLHLWNQAEKQLECCLNAFDEQWRLSAGDGAFYGPKIDIEIKDALGRYHQCATIQLDFQLPIQFNLAYVSKDGTNESRPVIIHRAVLGSLERMVAILAEDYAGKWPFWLSPRQIMVIPDGPGCEEYGQRVCQEFVERGFMADVDLDPDVLLNKKIQNSQLAQYNFILVVGEKEKVNHSVTVQTRDSKVHGEHSLAATIEKMKCLQQMRKIRAEEEF